MGLVRHVWGTLWTYGDGVLTPCAALFGFSLVLVCYTVPRGFSLNFPVFLFAHDSN